MRHDRIVSTVHPFTPYRHIGVRDLDVDTITSYLAEIYEGMLSTSETLYELEDYVLGSCDEESEGVDIDPIL